MKKKFKLGAILFIFLSLILFIINLNRFSNRKLFVYEIENKKHCLLIADEPREWQSGLMGYRKKDELRGADGMIFIFPDKQFRTFWNKNTYLNLEIIWLSDQKIVGRDFLPSILNSKEILLIHSPQKVNQVIELVK